MEKVTPIPDIYEETLDRIDINTADLHPLGITTFAELLNVAHRHMEGCGCGNCQRRFWGVVRECVEFEEVHGGERLWNQVMKDIDRFLPKPDDP